MSQARYIIGDSRRVMEALRLEGFLADAVMTSPPFLALREYLPPDHPGKALEHGREETPAEYIDALLAWTAVVADVLAPHGSLCVELGDTYSGSGGAGGDYLEGGLRDGQPAYAGSSSKARSSADRPGGGFRPNERAELAGTWSSKKRNPNPPPTWPMAKSLAMIPEAYRIALAYGHNPLNGNPSPAGRWIARNVVRWVRNNPPVGDDGDKFRRGTSEIIVATRARFRYFDGVAVRTPAKLTSIARANGAPRKMTARKNASAVAGGDQLEHDDFGMTATAPLLDWWLVSSQPYPGAHYATYPERLIEPIVKSMVPHKVCVVCGEPSRRISQSTNAQGRASLRRAHQDGAMGKFHDRTDNGEELDINDMPDAAIIETLGWTDCECPGEDRWRRGVLLDPFAGSGTTGQVATGLGHDAVLIDLDDRNIALASERIGMFARFELYLELPLGYGPPLIGFVPR